MREKLNRIQLEILFIWILLNHFGSFSLYASEIRFNKVTQISDKIKTMAKDSRGYMWFGTESQLLRYDGYQRTPLNLIFPQTKNQPIKGITKIKFNNDGSLFIGTRDNGLFKVDNDKTIHFSTNNNSILNAISSNFITALEEDEQSGLWIGTNEGLNLLSPSSKMINYPFNLKLSKKEKYITSILNLNDTELLVGTKAGAYIFNKIINNFIKLQLGGNTNQFAVNAIHRDYLNNIWIASHQGVFLKKYSEKNFATYRSDVFNQIVTSIVSDSNTIWVATFHNGLYKISSDSNTVENYASDKINLNSLSANTIRNLYLDNSRTLWVNTTTGGLNYFKTDALALGLYNNSKTSIYCASQNNFLDFDLDENQNLWLATNREFILFNENHKTCTRYKTDTYSNNQTNSNTLFSFEPSHQQPEMIWLSTYNGLLAFNKSSKSMDFSYFKSSGKGIYFTYEYSNYLVMGTNSGLILYNYITRNKIKINIKDTLLKNASVYDYATINANLILLATSEGVAIFDKFKKQFYFHETFKKVISNKRVTTLFIDEFNNTWIGTNLHGLFQFNSQNKLVQIFYNLGNQITLSNVYSMQYDKGKLWIGSNVGLISLDITSTEFHIYDEDDGMQGKYFFPEASYKSKAGNLFFGGKNGFNSFNPSLVVQELSSSSPIVLTNLFRFGKIVTPNNKDNGFSIERNIDDLDILELGHDDYIISFEFATLDFIKSKAVKYAYFLEGFEPQWNYVDSNNRRVTYTSLPIGEYKFRVKSFDGNSWNERYKQLRIISYPSIWFTWWAYSIYITSLILLFLGYYKYKINNNIKINLKLRDEVKKRTKELTDSKQQVETLLHKNNQFFENVSHEFKTPLTLILGPAKKLHDMAISPNQQFTIGIIKNNANRLLTMVEHILQISKYNNHNNLEKIAVKSHLVLNRVIESFGILADNNKVTLIIKNNDSSSVEVFQDTLEIILGNLISNAIKYTPFGGKVTISSQVNHKHLFIKISDTGCGLTTQQQTLIFERFKRLDSHATITGTGLGLSVVKELVKLNNFQLRINSKIGKGSTFILRILTLKDDKNSMNFHPNISSLNHLINFKSVDNNFVTMSKSYKAKKKKTILIIEDNREMSQYIASILKVHYNYIIANNGREGVKIAVNEIPNIVVCDIKMPFLNGFQVSHILRSDRLTSHIPIIILSALNDKINRIKGWQEHVDLYISKPFDSDELLSQINSILVVRNILKEKAGKSIKSLNLNSNSNLPKIEQEFLKKLFLIIKDNYSNPNFLRLELANKMFLSERQLQRKTASLINDSPMTLLRNYRLERAKEFLDDGCRVNYTADKCGFNSVTYFSKRFKSLYGVTPSEYKKSTLNRK